MTGRERSPRGRPLVRRDRLRFTCPVLGMIVAGLTGRRPAELTITMAYALLRLDR